jgi:hypothetical protein
MYLFQVPPGLCTGRKTGLGRSPVARSTLPRGGSRALADAAPLAKDKALRIVPDAIPGRIAGVHAFQEVVIEAAQIFDRLHLDGAHAAMDGPGNSRQPQRQFLIERRQ